MNTEGPRFVEMVADGRFAVFEHPDGGFSAQAAGALLEARERIRSEYRWHELAQVMGMIHRFHKLPPGPGRPPLLETFKDSDLPGRLYAAVVACAGELPEAMKKAADYLTHPESPPNKRGGERLLEQAVQVYPPEPFAVSVIVAACSAVAFRCMERRKRPGLSLVPTKGEIRKRWEKQCWLLPENAESARKPDAKPVPTLIAERLWPKAWKVIGLDDLKATPKKKAPAPKRRK
jgi:hypothetical protein